MADDTWLGRKSGSEPGWLPMDDLTRQWLQLIEENRMGWWKSRRGVIGDAPADVMDAALHKIQKIYFERAGRLPTQGEMADLFQFCSCSTFAVLCGDPKRPYSKEISHEEDYPRARPKGEQGAFGPAACPGPGELVNVDPASGDHLEAGELEALIEKQMNEASGKQRYDLGGEDK